VLLDLFISVFDAQKNGSWPKGPMVSDRRLPHNILGHLHTNIEKIARLSGRVVSKLVGALERRGYDIREKTSTPISRVARRVPSPKPKSDYRTPVSTEDGTTHTGIEAQEGDISASDPG
jgi:hypothetical protein